MTYKRKTKTERTFRGWDWEELSAWLGVNPDQDESVLLEQTRIKINKLASNLVLHKISPEEMKLIKGIRTFVSRLAKWENTYNQPLWKGLSAIEDDEAFLRFVDPLLPYMWD